MLSFGEYCPKGAISNKAVGIIIFSIHSVLEIIVLPDTIVNETEPVPTAPQVTVQEVLLALETTPPPALHVVVAPVGKLVKV